MPSAASLFDWFRSECREHQQQHNDGNRYAAENECRPQRESRLAACDWIHTSNTNRDLQRRAGANLGTPALACHENPRVLQGAAAFITLSARRKWIPIAHGERGVILKANTIGMRVPHRLA